MANNGRAQQFMTLIGSKSGTTRTGIELESTYSTTEVTEPTKTFPAGSFSRATFYIMYTMGASETSNSIEFKLESSGDKDDTTNKYRYVTDTTSGGTSTLAVREFTYVGVNGSTANIAAPIDINDKLLRISFKETGVSANKGSLFCEVLLEE